MGETFQLLALDDNVIHGRTLDQNCKPPVPCATTQGRADSQFKLEPEIKKIISVYGYTKFKLHVSTLEPQISNLIQKGLGVGFGKEVIPLAGQ